MPTNDSKNLSQRLQHVIIAFFLLAALSLLVVYFTDPSIYTKTLMLQSSPADRYPLPATLLLFGILAFISILIAGAIRHWGWLFWLLLIAFSFSILNIPATILQLTGLIPDNLPTWYSLYRMCIAIIEVWQCSWCHIIGPTHVSLMQQVGQVSPDQRTTSLEPQLRILQWR